MRLAYVDTEECQPPKGMSKFYKPITYGGKEAAEFLKLHLGFLHDGRPAPESARVSVDVEFDAVEDTIVGCRRHNQDNYGRVLAYLHVGGKASGENLSLAIVRAGFSPYHVKYGRSRLYHADFLEAERTAMAEDRGVWGLAHAVEGFFYPGDYTRDYSRLLPWWWMREEIVQDFRRWEAEGVARHVFVPRVHKDELIAAANDRKTITVFVDFQPKNPYVDLGIMRDVEYIAAGQTKVGTVIYAGTKAHPFNLWIDNARSSEAAKIKTLIERRYSRTGRNYAYVHGKAFTYHKKGIPQIQVDFADQITDTPNKDPLKLHHSGEAYHLAAASVKVKRVAA